RIWRRSSGLLSMVVEGIKKSRTPRCAAVVNKGLEPNWCKVAGQALNQAFRQADMHTSARETFHLKVHRLRTLSTGKHPREPAQYIRTNYDNGSGMRQYGTLMPRLLRNGRLQFQLQILRQRVIEQLAPTRQIFAQILLLTLTPAQL